MNEPSPNGDNGRDASGRFAPGNRGGPGNPFARRVGELRKAMLEAVGEDGVRRIVGSLVKAAEGGDAAAAKLVFAYTVGTPGPAPDPDELDLHERRLDDAREDMDRHKVLTELLSRSLRGDRSE